MRITVHLPDATGENLKRAAANQGVSASHLVAEAIEDYLLRQRRNVLGEKVLDVARKVRVSSNALDLLEEGRVDDRS